MSTFVMLGKYSLKGVKGIAAERTEKAAELIKSCGGELSAMYALLGEHDLLFIADFAGTKEAMKASVALSKLTGISFSTAAALPVEEFDKLMAEL